MKKVAKCLFGILSLFVISCSKDTTTPIQLEIESYYEFPMGKTSTITIQDNGDYQMSVEDSSILKVSYTGINQISITPINKGETRLVIHDKKKGTTATTNIKIVDSYYSFGIWNFSHPPFLSDVYLFFILNASNDLYIFDDNFRLLNKGSYTFGRAERNYTLTIEFDEEYNNYNDLSLVIRKDSGESIYYLIETMLSNQGLKSSLNDANTREVAPKIMYAVDENTGIEYPFVLKNEIMPYYILK